ncbi:Gmad2 immunoglobulin-like domain-containing protein [Candidatus Woesebacteria bacterium]|nr:Gmad2 immunoglobulin-like domain-containing protein [Candidatus Woesebacteria bacterium]MCD8507364.1 Gmad2 immunoglobulin-like domain-containing protein [Candidatus Woesebacteria bacterium]MCD8527167.1 Gmad2 immunoglobulin-like domain-containing protein [Candidatus Woesebacteria bacterium]MCD8546796.1 Gmad2 immunoglobulin-like domain-containing protein [Candidatus Woesebacteria bacterium]
MRRLGTILLVIFGFGILLFLVFWQFNRFMPANETSPEQIPPPTWSPTENENGNSNGSATPGADVSSPTSSWETFTDSVYGYSTEYPAEWRTRVTTSLQSESQITSYDTNELPSTDGVPPEELKIAVARFYPNSQISYVPPTSEDTVSQENITVAGENATRRRVQSAFGESVSVEFMHEGSTFVVTAIPADSQYIGVFDHVLETLAFAPNVGIESPDPQESLTSPVQVTGYAPGTWFFEGQLSVELQTAQGETIAQASLAADGTWMTENEVDFSGELTFDDAERAVESLRLVLMKANPSGLPENAQSVSIPVQVAE